jgi:predicted CoA-binding protein
MGDDLIGKILSDTRTVAVVGLSSREERPSNGVARRLVEAGFDVIPVNPTEGEVLGRKCYRSLDEVPVPVDLVDVFRRSAEVLPVAEAAVRIGARYFWMQEGVENGEARALLEKAGIAVVENRCVKKELAKRGR